jgi:hypothetical protein
LYPAVAADGWTTKQKGTGMSEPMSDERLADLDQRITNSCDTYDCNCDNAPCGLEPREARKLLAEVKRLRNDVADRDYVNAGLRKTIEKYRAQLAETGETELEWGVRITIRATDGPQAIPQSSEEKARKWVEIIGSGVLICRTKAGEWREAEQEG